MNLFKMKLVIIALLVITITGCKASHQSIMQEAAEYSNPQEIYTVLKEAKVDEQDVLKLQASVLYFSLKTPESSFQEEAQKLFNLVGQSEMGIDTADQGIQTMLYLAGIATDNNNYNTRIDRNIKIVVDELCVPSNELGYKIADIEAFSDAYYAYHIAKACQAVIHDRSAAKDISVARLIRQEEDCRFSEYATDATTFFSELFTCRLNSHAINITNLQPQPQEVH